MPGQHWLLIFVNPEIVYLIDSYGMPPAFINYVKSYTRLGEDFW